MSAKWCAASTLALLGAMNAVAQEPIEPEELTVEQEIAPGANVFVVTSSWGGASAVSIFSADDLTYKGDIATGMTPQFALGADNETGYVTSAFADRITYGPISAYLQSFDIKTLEFGTEVSVPEKMAQTAAQAVALALSSDGKWAFVQNATPATSISVVNLSSGKIVSEIPNPGCWGIYPSTTPFKYSTVCGNGTITTYKLKSSGELGSQATSDTVFDVESKPIFVHPQRDGDTLFFVTYDGTLLEVDDSGKAAKVTDEWTFTDGLEGDWAPGGYEITAYNAPNKVLFVLMHAGATDGSHKDGSDELWALDVENQTVLYRTTTVDPMTHIAITQDEDMPLLYGTNSHGGSFFRYEIDPEAKFAAKLTTTKEIEGVGYLVAEH